MLWIESNQVVFVVTSEDLTFVHDNKVVKVQCVSRLNASVMFQWGADNRAFGDSVLKLDPDDPPEEVRVGAMALVVAAGALPPEGFFFDFHFAHRY